MSEATGCGGQNRHSLGVVTVDGCSELRKTWGGFSTFELSHLQTRRSRPGKESGSNSAWLGQRKVQDLSQDGRFREATRSLPLGWTAEPAHDPTSFWLKSSLRLEVKPYRVLGSYHGLGSLYLEPTQSRDKKSYPRDELSEDPGHLIHSIPSHPEADSIQCHP